MCFLPVVIAGTITNLLNFVVLTQKKMRRRSTSVYLLALTVADLGVMYVELLRVWFEWQDFVDPCLYFTDVYCKLVNFINGIIRDFSNWLIAALTMERLVMIACPFKARSFCTVHRAKCITGWLLVLIVLPQTHFLFFSVARKEVWWVCWENPNSKLAPIIGALESFLIGYIVVPVVFVLNLVLIIYLLRPAKILRCLPQSCMDRVASPLSSPVASVRNGSQRDEQQRLHNHQQGFASTLHEGRIIHHRRLTKTLILIALVFLICETPRMIMSFIVKFNHRTPMRRIILNISYLISGINHASNFFIYVLSSPRFRTLFMEALYRRKIIKKLLGRAPNSLRGQLNQQGQPELLMMSSL